MIFFRTMVDVTCTVPYRPHSLHNSVDSLDKVIVVRARFACWVKMTKPGSFFVV